MNWKNLIIPFAQTDKRVKIASVVIIPVLIWILLPNRSFPPLEEVIFAIPKLITKNDLLPNFAISIVFCLTSMFYATLISFLFLIIANIPIFNSFASFCRKFRFLPSVGLSFLFMKMTNNVSSQMSWIMVFGIATFLIDAAVGVALSITKDDVSYAKSLRLSPWQALRELIIYGKMADFFNLIIQNFAMAWMLLATVENICKSSGGIGVVISESAKYFHLEEVYAIQLLILLTGILMDFILNKIRYLLFPYTKLKQSK